jgi:hypothetical protein
MRLSAGILAVASVVATPNANGQTTRLRRHDDLVALFADWRTFQQPKLVDGVPDYSPAAMAAQHRELATYQKRLS